MDYDMPQLDFLDERCVLCSAKLNFVSREMKGTSRGISKDMALDKFNSR